MCHTISYLDSECLYEIGSCGNCVDTLFILEFLHLENLGHIKEEIARDSA